MSRHEVSVEEWVVPVPTSIAVVVCLGMLAPLVVSVEVLLRGRRAGPSVMTGRWSALAVGLVVAVLPYLVAIPVLRAVDAPDVWDVVPVWWAAVALLLAPLGVEGTVASGRSRARSRA